MLHDEYLRQLHLYLKPMIRNFHHKNGGEQLFLNSFIISDYLDDDFNYQAKYLVRAAVEHNLRLNKHLELEDLRTSFDSFYINEHLEIEYIFKMWVEIDEEIDEVIIIYNKHGCYNQDDFGGYMLSELDDELIKDLIQTVKRKISFGFLCYS